MSLKCGNNYGKTSNTLVKQRLNSLPNHNRDDTLLHL